MKVIGWSSALVATEVTNIVIGLLAAAGHGLLSAGQGVYLFLIMGVFNPGIRQEWMKIIHSVPHECRNKGEAPSQTKTLSSTPLARYPEG